MKHDEWNAKGGTPQCFTINVDAIDRSHNYIQYTAPIHSVFESLFIYSVLQYTRSFVRSYVCLELRSFPRFSFVRSLIRQLFHSC